MKLKTLLLAATSLVLVGGTLGYAQNSTAIPEPGPQTPPAETVAAGPSVTIEQIVDDASSPADILSNGLGPQGHRYSSLETINTENVGGMLPAWAFSFGGEKQRGQESQPLIHDGILYVTGSYSRIYAIDVKTGEKIWQYDARLPEGILPCCDVVNRGAAILGDKVYFGTLDAKLVALNAKTGDVVWVKEIGDYEAGYSYTAAPLIVPTDEHGPLIVTGNSGGEFGIVGEIQARNPETGDLVWTRPTIEGHMGTYMGQESTMTGERNATWEGDMWQNGGGATWLGGTYDPETKLIFMGTGNPAPWNSHLRPGDNKWTSSRLAVNPENGEIVWGFQTTPHDGWDFDGVNEFISFDLEKDGQTIKAGATADRNGFFYVLNRENGEFIDAYPFVTQINWASDIDDDGRPIWNEANRPGNPAEVSEGNKGEQVFAVPSFLGGKNWQPMGYSHNTGLFYVPSNEWGMDIWNEPIAYKKGAAYLGAGFTIKPLYEDYIGSLKAMDPATGEVKWEYKNPAPLWGGVLSTAGGLVFIGTPEGYLKAFNDETGEELWKFQVGTGIVSSPVTWEMDGEQWVGVTTGWGGAVPLWGGEVANQVKDINQGGSFWAFKLPKEVASAN
jgi:alcohol dehydrogenase (cytochrome c)